VKYCLWIVLLLSASSLLASDNQLRGYVLDATAFRNIQTYCIDTRYLPPLKERVIHQFVAHESRPRGLLAKLPWHRLTSCGDGAADVRVRLEFPPDHSLMQVMRNDVNGVLFVFKSGSPTPIYETREVVVQGDENGCHTGCPALFCEQNAVDSAVRALIHDWLKFTAPAASSPGARDENRLDVGHSPGMTLKAERKRISPP